MSYKRTNNSNEATIDKSRIFASGTFKNVWAGTYTDGQRAGQRCVAKEFKTGSVLEAHFFDQELEIIRHTQEILDAFNTAVIIVDKNLVLNTPEVWTRLSGVGRGHKALVEPMIVNFEKFNSNTGWTGRNCVWNEAMQALSHFSYHDSNREFLLCDLQGGSYSDGFIISDPVIMSQDNNCGPADLGVDGIRTFFQRHQCGRFCNRQWVKPAVVGRAPLPMVQGTTMVTRNLPTRSSRNPMSRLRE